MKKILLLILSLVMAIAVVIPIATPVSANTNIMYYLGINSNVNPLSPLNNAQVRLAVYKALDRDAIAIASGGTKVVSIVTPFDSNPNVNRSYDPVFVKNVLLPSAGYPNGFTTTLTIPNNNPVINNLAVIVKANLYAVGIEATIETLEAAVFMAKTSAKLLPFFFASTPVDNSIMPSETLGRLLLSSSPSNFTGYNKAQFDFLFNTGQYVPAENYAFDPTSGGLPIVPLSYWVSPYFTIRVQAKSNPGLPTSLPDISVPIAWSKTGGAPGSPSSGTGNTAFNILMAGGNVTLTAPLNYSNEQNFYIFKQWMVGTPPALPDITISNTTVTFTPTADKLATVRYEPQITGLGYIYPQVPDVNPVGISHTVWVNVFRPIEGGKVPVSGIKVTFKIDGANPAASGFTYSDATGKAQFTYTGVNDGMDTIQSYIDSNKNGVYDSGEPSTINTTGKSWVKNFVTGGGNLKVGNKVAWTFDVNLCVLPEGGVVGKFDIVNHNTKVTYHLNQFSMLSFYGGESESPPASRNTARFRGTGLGSDGSTITLVVIIEDAGEGQKGDDRIAIVQVSPDMPPIYTPWIGNIPFPPPTPPPSPTLIAIDGGNFQVHNMK